MAKYKTSCLVSEIKGSIGNKTFSYWKGIPVVKKRIEQRKKTNSLRQGKIREIFEFLKSKWSSMSFEDWAVWDSYAEQNKRIKSKKRSGLMSTIGNWFYGNIAFISTNQLLMGCGFSFIQKPPFDKPQPLLPATDLPEYSKWNKDIKFKIWLPEDYPDRCVVQIWIKKLSKTKELPYIMAIVPVPSSPIEIKIEKIRFYVIKRGKRKILEKNLNEIENSKILLQMRTVAENGKFSMPGPIHKMELINHSSCESPQTPNPLNSSTLKPLNSSSSYPIAKNRIRFKHP